MSLPDEQNLQNAGGTGDGEYEADVIVDGIFDCTHFGHANSVRLAHEFGERVIAGLHHDDEVKVHKFCYPVFTTEERQALIGDTKYCDGTKVIPYIYNIDDLESWKIKVNAHGDEVVESGTGIPLFQGIREAGRFKTFQRTLGISTTDIIDAALNLKRQPEPIQLPTHTKFDLKLSYDVIYTDFVQLINVHFDIDSGKTIDPSRHIPVTKGIIDEIVPNEKKGSVIYTEGAFDLFNIGHLKFLQSAKQRYGDFVIVGIYGDETLQEQKGKGHPLVNQLHRALTVLSHRCVDAVILRGPNPRIDKTFLDIIQPHIVCIGCESDPKALHLESSVHANAVAKAVTTVKYTPTDNYYADAEQRGLFRVVDSGSTVTTNEIVIRIYNVIDSYESRNEKKHAQLARQAVMWEEQKRLEREQKHMTAAVN